MNINKHVKNCANVELPVLGYFISGLCILGFLQKQTSSVFVGLRVILHGEFKFRNVFQMEFNVNDARSPCQGERRVGQLLGE